MSVRLAARHCIPDRGGPPLRGAELAVMLRDLGGAWYLTSDQRLERALRFGNFRDALTFANRVGELAEAEMHYPELLVGWGRLVVTLSTPAAYGLTENDFIIAAKVDGMIGYRD